MMSIAPMRPDHSENDQVMTSTILAKLEATLGTTEFDVVFQSLKSMKATEVAAIASVLVSKTAKSAPKRDSLNRIYSRHLNLMTSVNKAGWHRSWSA